MLRAKAVHFRKHGAKATDKFMTSTDKSVCSPASRSSRRRSTR